MPLNVRTSNGFTITGQCISIQLLAYTYRHAANSYLHFKNTLHPSIIWSCRHQLSVRYPIMSTPICICSSCLHMTPLDRFSGAGASFLFLLVLLDLKLSISKGEGVDGVRSIKGVLPYRPFAHVWLCSPGWYSWEVIFCLYAGCHLSTELQK